MSGVVTHGFFVTGTDTGVGKTLVACALLHALAGRGLRAAGMKPVAAGAVLERGLLVNDDVDALIAASNVDAPRVLVNPYCFAPAIAPHIAAAEADTAIDLALVEDAYRKLAVLADCVIVEGAGGFRVPLGPLCDMRELARRLGAPVVLVVGVRLGCLNHALLTAESVDSAGLTLAGWVANVIESEMPRRRENILALRERLPAPLLGTIEYCSTPDARRVARQLDLGSLPLPAARSSER